MTFRGSPRASIRRTLVAAWWTAADQSPSGLPESSIFLQFFKLSGCGSPQNLGAVQKCAPRLPFSTPFCTSQIVGFYPRHAFPGWCFLTSFLYTFQRKTQVGTGSQGASLWRSCALTASTPKSQMSVVISIVFEHFFYLSGSAGKPPSADPNPQKLTNVSGNLTTTHSSSSFSTCFFN